jgi:hypothetical protein
MKPEELRKIRQLHLLIVIPLNPTHPRPPIIAFQLRPTSREMGNSPIWCNEKQRSMTNRLHSNDQAVLISILERYLGAGWKAVVSHLFVRRTFGEFGDRKIGPLDVPNTETADLGNAQVGSVDASAILEMKGTPHPICSPL